MRNNIDKLKQVRDALCKHHAYQAQCGMADYVTSSILFLDTEKALSTLDTLIADCSAVDVEALRWEDEYSGIIGDEPLYETGFEQGFNAAIELMKGKE